jgi:hypothetical protein
MSGLLDLYIYFSHCNMSLPPSSFLDSHITFCTPIHLSTATQSAAAAAAQEGGRALKAGEEGQKGRAKGQARQKGRVRQGRGRGAGALCLHETAATERGAVSRRRRGDGARTPAVHQTGAVRWGGGGVSAVGWGVRGGREEFGVGRVGRVKGRKEWAAGGCGSGSDDLHLSRGGI